MRTFNWNQKVAGELAVRKLSEDAQRSYSEISYLDVFEVGDKYFIRGCFDCDNLTLAELEEELESLIPFLEETEEEYTPSSTYGDYSPSNPWYAPGMSISDFI